MNRTRPLVKYGVCVSAALACATAMAMLAPQPEATEIRKPEPRAAYLNCARIASGWAREPDLVTVCVMVAETPMEGGNGKKETAPGGRLTR